MIYGFDAAHFLKQRIKERNCKKRTSYVIKMVTLIFHYLFRLETPNLLITKAAVTGRNWHASKLKLHFVLQQTV